MVFIISGIYIRITMMYPLILCVTLVVVVSGYGRYRPSPSNQLTKADIDYVTDTNTLITILARLMKVQEDTDAQGMHVRTYIQLPTHPLKSRAARIGHSCLIKLLAL